MVADQINWIDVGVIAIVLVVVGGIFYRALKEPIDLVLGWLKGMFGKGVDAISSSEGGTIIKYG